MNVTASVFPGYVNKPLNNTDWNNLRNMIATVLSSGDYDVIFSTVTASTYVGLPDFNFTAVAGENISAGNTVRIFTDGKLYKGSNASFEGVSGYVGIATSTVVTGDDLEVATLSYSNLTGLTPGAIYYVGAGGVLTTTRSPNFIQVAGFAISATALMIAAAIPQLPISYHRPNLVYGSATTVSLESGLDGTSGDIRVIFPDNNVRIVNNTTYTTFDITRNAALSGGSKQSGLRSGLTEANSWYALYAVKTTDDSASFVTVGDTTLPNDYTTLNSNFGTNGWEYLGYILNNTDIVLFTQDRNRTLLRNTNANLPPGIRLSTSASTQDQAWTYAAGVSLVQIPATLNIGIVNGFSGVTDAPLAAYLTLSTQADSTNHINVVRYSNVFTNFGTVVRSEMWLTDGIRITKNGGENVTMSIYLSGWIDPLL